MCIFISLQKVDPKDRFTKISNTNDSIMLMHVILRKENRKVFLETNKLSYFTYQIYLKFLNSAQWQESFNYETVENKNKFT